MKCKYCNAEIEQDAQFCTNCGKDLSKFKRCVSCGELLDRDTEFCPFCGTKQTLEEQNLPEGMAEPLQLEEKKGSKKWLWAVIAVILLAIIGGGTYFATNGGLGSKALAEAVDSDSFAVVDGDIDLGSLKTELEQALQVVVKDYDKSYFSDGFNDFYLRGCKKADKEGAEHPKIWWQYSDSDPEAFKIKTLTKSSENEGNAVVTIIGELYQVDFNVRLKDINGRWLIDEITEINGSQRDISEVMEGGCEDGISIEDAINVAENMIIKEGEFKGFSSEEDVNYIMLNKYGYKYEKHYFIEREWDFSPLYYKNCIFAQSIKDGDFVGYVGVPTARGEGISSFVGFDNGQMVIAPFTQSVFKDYIKQIERLGGKCIESDNSTKTYKLNSFDIVTFGDGAMGIDYCITISRN